MEVGLGPLGLQCQGEKKLFAEYNQNDQVKDYEMRRACSTNGVDEEFIQNIGGKARKKEITMKTKTKQGVNIKMNLREIGSGGMDWIELAQDRAQWKALVIMVMNLRVP